MHVVEPLVRVRVEVNVDSLRRGWEGDVELTPRIEALVKRGYLKVLGHAEVPPEPLPVPEAVLPPETPARAAKPPRAKRDRSSVPQEGSAPDGDSEGNRTDQ